MTILIFCILLNVLVSLIFKVFPKYEIDVLKAIIVNYFVCVLTAAAAMNNFHFLNNLWSQPWLPWAIGMGILFFFVFLAIGKTVAHHGVMVATTSQKLSLILPVLVSFLFFKEPFTPLKLAGIVCAIGAVFAINYRHNNSKSKAQALIFLLPVITWLGSSMVDLSLFLVEKLGVSEGAGLVFTASLFLFAGISGLTYLILSGGSVSIQQDKTSFFAGVALGVPNFFSIYLIVYLLEAEWQGSVLFPVLNVSIILLSTLAGVIFFKEHFSRPKRVGFFLAILAIILLSVNGRP